MTSDPFNLVNDRMFKEMREYAQRDRLVQAGRTVEQPRNHGRLRTLGDGFHARLHGLRLHVLKRTHPLPR